MMKLNSLNKVSLKFIIPSKRKLEENPYLQEFVPSNCSLFHTQNLSFVFLKGCFGSFYESCC